MEGVSVALLVDAVVGEKRTVARVEELVVCSATFCKRRMTVSPLDARQQQQQRARSFSPLNFWRYILIDISE